jgi:outer membrane murein-binding lipoprotein Lpp
MSVQGRITVIAMVSSSLLLSGCMGMNKMFMTADQEAQYCSAYRQQLGMVQNAQQRAQIISAMHQMDCPNTPAQ